MKRILCVIRTSTIRQEIESQHNDMVGFLLSKGYSEDEIEWLESKGASARCANKSYLDMLETIKSIISSSTTIKACAVWHLNRLGRIESYITSMREWFTNNHIQLYVKNPDITLLNPDGTYNTGNNIVFAVFAATIPAETEEMMEKFRRGKQRKKEEGKYIGGFVPFGFRIVDGYQVVDDEKMKLVKLVFEEYATGNWSYYKLQNELHSRGLGFTVRHLALLMNNPIYKPYVGDELWEKCEKVRTGNLWNLNTKESKYCHLGLKIVRCEKCGSTYIADNHVYVCLIRKQGKRYGKSCDGMSVKAEVIDTILWDEAVRLHRRFLMRNTTDSITDNEKNRDVIIEKISKIDSDLSKYPDKLERIRELYIEGDLTKIQYESRKKKIESEIGDLSSQKKILEDNVKKIEETIMTLKNPNIMDQFELMVSVGNIAPSDERKSIVRLHIDHISVGETFYNDRKCSLMTLYDKYGNVSRFIYDFNGSKHTKSIFAKLYRIRKDGVIVRYSQTGKTMTELSNEQIEGAVGIIENDNKVSGE